jgi:indole-3-glycerol phosphate synthase
MADRIGSTKLKIAESGISEPKDMVRFRTYGFEGCLIGERFMKILIRERRSGLLCLL